MSDALEIHFRPKDVRRFIKKVRVFGPESCWSWKGRLDRYGNVKVQGHDLKAHRVAYLMMRGPIGDGLLVRHTCDNRGCVNPDHLELGTHQDNSNDLVRRGKAGRPCPITEDGCLSLFRRYEMRDCSAKEFAEREDLSLRSLHRYVRMARERLSGKAWSEISVTRAA